MEINEPRIDFICWQEGNEAVPSFPLFNVWIDDTSPTTIGPGTLEDMGLTPPEFPAFEDWKAQQIKK